MRIDHGLLPGHVLQRTPKGASATITGSCAVSGPVLATVRKGAKALPKLKGVVVGTAADGRFTATLKGLPTGGPYTVELACASARVTVPGIHVGDLWLMAGQSNMEGVGLISDAPQPHPLVRNFSMARYWEEARDPLHYLSESPDRVHGGATRPASELAKAKRKAVKGTGVGVYFGTLMHDRSGVPQGLIATAHGGTSMAQWDPALKDQGGDSLYGSMWLSLQAVGQPVAGVLWYQGCSDADPKAGAVYTAKMQELVAAVRRDLGQPRLPWVIVQIGRVVDMSRDPRPWNGIQEQQRLLPTSIPQCDVVPAVDLELDDLIHISGKAFATLAQRMARVAARLVLGDRREAPAPQPKSIRLIESKTPGLAPVVEVRFANIVGGLQADGLPQGFTLVDSQQRLLDLVFKTELAGDAVRLHLKDAPQVAASVQYGYGPNPVCNVHDGRGMGIPVFGPWRFANPLAVSAWTLRWRVTPLRPGEDIAALPAPDAGDATAVERAFVNDFVNLHGEWQGKSGNVAFTSYIEVPEDMEAEVRVGYDGPIRLWLGGKEIHTNLLGTNPAIKDAVRVRTRLTAGRHPLGVLMALNGGRAWGFFLRFARVDADASTQPQLPVPWS